jgi:hypothetical protein
MRCSLRSSAYVLAALAVVGAGGCTESHGPGDAPLATSPDLAAASLGSLADQARMGGDTLGAAVFAEAQAAVSGATRTGVLRVTQDNATEDWRAVAYRTRVPAWCPLVLAPTTPLVCRLGGGTSLVAWSTVRPERLLMVAAPEGSSTVAGPAGPTPPSASAMPRVTYVDRSVVLALPPVPVPVRPGTTPSPAPPTVAPMVSAPWFATAGSFGQETVADTVSCPAGAVAPLGAFGRCTLGRSTVRFGVTVALPPLAGVSAAPRVLSAPATTVPAVVWQLDSVPTRVPVPVPGPTPVPGSTPVPPPAPAPVLVSRLEVLGVTRDAVSLRLTVRNVSAAPQVLGYASGQRVDFEALGGGLVAWRWSASQSFPAVTGTDTVAAGAERRYEATWRGPTRGAWVVRGFTVNTSGPRTESVAPVVVP